MRTFDEWRQTEDFIEWQAIQCSILNCSKAEHDEFLMQLRNSGQPMEAYGKVATMVFVCGFPVSDIKNITNLTDEIPMIELSRGDE